MGVVRAGGAWWRGRWTVPLAALSATATVHARKGQPTWTVEWGAFCLAKGRHAAVRAADDTLCCGEDAYVAIPGTEHTVLAVADGVGGWRRRGIDPGRFSRGLLQAMQALDVVPSPATLLVASFWRMVETEKASKEPPHGSSTACVAVFDHRQGRLRVANVGDSGAILVRAGRILMRTVPQQYRFNAPYQLSWRPNGDVCDAADLVATYECSVADGDVLVIGSDGLLDNLFDRDIVEGAAAAGDADRTAEALVQRAKSASLDPRTDTPFSLEVRRQGVGQYQGGKPDDISVVVAVFRAASGSRVSGAGGADGESGPGCVGPDDGSTGRPRRAAPRDAAEQARTGRRGAPAA